MEKVRKLIGVIVSDVSAEYSRRTVRGIIRQAKEYDYNVAVFSTFIQSEGTDKHKTGEKNIFRLPNYELFDGFIVMPNSIKIDGAAQEVIDDLKERCTCPVVCGDTFNSFLYQIPIDEKSDFKTMVEHFIIKHKFTKINCLTGPKGVIHSELRLEGYKEALKEHNLLVEENRIWYGDFKRESGKEMVEAMLKSTEPLPEAIVCANDYMAITVCKALKEAGIRVPEDISVSGYDNVREANLNTPSITTLMPPNENIGRRCVKYIHQIIEGHEESDGSVLSGDIVFAESCGCKIDNAYDRSILIKQKNYQYVLDTMKDEFSLMNLMGEHLSGVSTLEDLIAGLKEHIYLLKDYKDFYLCLCDKWDAAGEEEDNYLISGYTKTMRMEFAHKNGEYIQGGYEFPVEQMLPDLFEAHDKMHTYFFSPIHFKDRCFGYGVLSIGDGLHLLDYTYRSWIRNVNNGLEFVRVQNNLRWFYNKLDEIAIRDALTGAFNRRGLERYINPVFSKMIEEKQPFVMMVGDLDNLKKINDSFGHMEGDKAIQAVTRAFSSLQSADTVLARTGGDEFVLAFRDSYSYEQVEAFRQSIYYYLHKLNEELQYPYLVSVSIGIYYGVPEEGSSISECHSIADHNMYKEKSMKKEFSGSQIVV